MEESRMGNYEAHTQTGPVANKQKKEKKENKNTGFKVAVLTMAGLALVFSVGSATMSAYVLVNGLDNTSTVSNDSGDYYDGNSVEFEETTIAAVAEKVTPAVVSILTETQVRSYFGGTQTSSGAGTGMIVSSNGYIITNNHVIDGADTVAVVTDAGDTYENVEVVGTDPLNDVAYLKISGVSGLPTVTLGDSKTISAGQPVLAIGNALGVYTNSITQGIVSGTGRSITATDSSGTSSEDLTDMIQTDAAINSGNSGGPLVNAAGEVIGINTAVSTTAQGMGFAIPISSTKGMLKNIIENGKAERAYLGVSYISITADVAKEYDLTVKRGAYIYGGSSSAVVSGGPADKAGVKNGDIILTVGGVEVGSKGSILSLVGEYMAGETVELGILRDGKEGTLNVTLGSYSN